MHRVLCPHMPTRHGSQAPNVEDIVYRGRKRAQLVSIEVLLVAEITGGQCRGIKGLRKPSTSSSSLLNRHALSSFF